VLRGDHLPSDVEREQLSALYDGELAFLDTELRRLFAVLKALPQWDDMLVIVTSDHGEALGEHGLLGHGVHLYEEFTRVPLFVKPPTPSAPHGTVVPGIHQLVDVFALVMQHVGLDVPEDTDARLWGRGRQDGRAWAYATYEGRRRYAPRLSRDLRSIVSDGWKLIEASDSSLELYNLADDPEELTNVAPAHSALVGRLLERLGPWPAVIDMAQQREPVEESLREQLRALGYVR
jgi:arylsulfatase A-like enzyme